MSSQDPQHLREFTGLLKYNPAHANCFDMRDFGGLISFSNFMGLFSLFMTREKTLLSLSHFPSRYWNSSIPIAIGPSMVVPAHQHAEPTTAEVSADADGGADPRGEHKHASSGGDGIVDLAERGSRPDRCLGVRRVDADVVESEVLAGVVGGVG